LYYRLIATTFEPPDGIKDQYWEYVFPLEEIPGSSIPEYPDIKLDLTPPEAWILPSSNITHFICNGTPAFNQLDTYTLKITAYNSSDGVLYTESLSNTFKITLTNSPPVIGTLYDTSITVPEKLDLNYGSSLVTDSDTTNVFTSLKFNDSDTFPTWLIYDINTFTFETKSTTNDIVGFHKITILADDRVNPIEEKDFIIEIIFNPAPQKQNSISTIKIMNYHLINVTFQDIDILFTDPNSLGMNASMTTINDDPLPSFLTFDNDTNTLTGTPTIDDVGKLNLKYIATNDDGLTGYISFKIKIYGMFKSTISFVF